MFGEFEDDRLAVAASNARTDDVPLWRRIGLHLASQADVSLKSQQRGEPELTTEEKVELAKELMDSSPSQFLYRFGRFLRVEHLAYFEEVAQQDAVVAHYLTDAREKLDLNKHKTRVRNRRWAAVQRLRDSSTASEESRYGDVAAGSNHEGYFTEAEMKKRNPLLYQQLIGQHLTTEEINEQKQCFDRSDCRFTTIIYDHLDQCYEKEFKKKQEEQEDDMFEEEDDETDDEEGNEAMEQDEEAAQIEPEHKTLLKEEFLTSMYNSFISGKDDTFNYKSVDENEEFDLLDIEGLDKEEKYFDEEESCEVASMGSAPESPALPRLCLDRRTLNHPNYEPKTTASDRNQEPHEQGPGLPPTASLTFPSNDCAASTSDQNLPAVEFLSIK